MSAEEYQAKNANIDWLKCKTCGNQQYDIDAWYEEYGHDETGEYHDVDLVQEFTCLNCGAVYIYDVGWRRTSSV